MAQEYYNMNQQLQGVHGERIDTEGEVLAKIEEGHVRDESTSSDDEDAEE